MSAGFIFSSSRAEEREGGEPQLENGAEEDGGVSERDDPIPGRENGFILSGNTAML